MLILQLACSEQTCHWEPENLVRVRAKSLQFCSTLCDPMDYSPPGSTVHGIFQTRILKWAAIPFSRGSSWPRDRTHVSCISCLGRQILYKCTTWGAWVMVKVKYNMHHGWEQQAQRSKQSRCQRPHTPPSSVPWLKCKEKVWLTYFSRQFSPPSI